MSDLWLIYYSDKDRGVEVFSGEGAEQAARTRHAALLPNWNCYLLCECAAQRADSAEQRLEEALSKAYHAGFVDALATYAVWRNGQQWVGDPGKPLKEAQAAAEKSWNYRADKVSG